AGPDGLPLALLERRYDSRGLLVEELRRGLEARAASAPAAGPAANPARGPAGSVAPAAPAAPGTKPTSPAPAGPAAAAPSGSTAKAEPTELRYRFRYQAGALAGRWERSVLLVSDAFGGDRLELVAIERSLYGDKLP
ncbi:MAG: hypothetical protein JNG85_11965, partial [Spirochaetaceae bacterium]|nr:hypothetical protein [Spirochaetaceae bacterium]